MTRIELLEHIHNARTIFGVIWLSDVDSINIEIQRDDILYRIQDMDFDEVTDVHYSDESRCLYLGVK